MATVTKTIGTSSRDYSTITSWEADLDDFMTYGMGDDAVGEIYNDSVFDESFTVNGGSSVGLNSIKLTVASSDRHDGTAGSGARLVKSTTTAGYIATLDSTVSPVTLEWLEISSSSTFNNSGSSSGAVSLGAGSDYQYTRRIQNCIIHNCEHDSGSGRMEGINGQVSDCDVTNNIIYDITTGNTSSGWCYGLQAYAAGGSRTMNVYNNTIYNTVNDGGWGNCYGLRFYSSTGGGCQNNLVIDTSGSSSGTIDDMTASGSPDYNGTSDTTASGTNSLNSLTAANLFVSTVAGSEDLHLKAGADAIGEGNDVGTSPANVNIDIDGRDRDSEGDVWDMGADQYVASGGGEGGGYNKAIAHPITLPVSRPIGRNIFEQR